MALFGAHDNVGRVIADDGTLREAPREREGPRTANAPFLFLLFECARPLAGGARFGLGGADEIVLGRGAARGAARTVQRGARHLAIGVPDRRMSTVHARIVRRGAGLVVEDAGSTNGSRVNGAALTEPVDLRDGDLLELGHSLFLFRSALPLRDGQAADADAAELRALPRGMRTLSPAYALALATLRKVARSNVSILLLGETGTGKEVVARAIHEESRRKGPFVAVNCGALPDALVESQLFGHARGAFSGAVKDELGIVRAAHGGTLFLDEIGELAKPSQVALLRVLQEREVVPVGTATPIAVDVRFVAATNAHLERDAATGEFRSDLFARLAGLVHTLPPLRERREDLGLLVEDALTGAGATHLTMRDDVGRALARYDWPRNVRELHHAMSLAMVLAAPGDVLEAAHLPTVVTEVGECEPAARATPETGDDELRRRLVALLDEHAGNVAEVARVVGKGRNQVYRWLERFAIDATTFRR